MLVSVLIPIYNYEPYVLETLESIWQQTYRDIEIVVVDDGSEDNSFSVCQDASRTSPFPMKVLRGGRLGVSGAMKMAMANSSGELVSVVHADDIHLPSKIERQVEQFVGSDNICLSHTEYRCIDVDGRDLGFGSEDSDLPPADGDCLRDLLLLKSDVRSISMMFRRTCLERQGGYESRYPYEDWQAILKLAAAGPVRHVNQPLVLRRLHPHNKHINVTKFPDFNPDQMAPEILGRVCPVDLDVEKVMALHLGTLIVSSITSGNVAKGISASRYGYTYLPRFRLYHSRSVALGFVHLVWNRCLVPLLPKSIPRGFRWLRKSMRDALPKR